MPNYISEWTAVKVKVMIPRDLETTPLQIKTDSTLGSGEKILVQTFGKDNSFIGGVSVKFSSTIQYQIAACTSGDTKLSVQPPAEMDKIWTIIKTETDLIITCNNVEVLNYLFADSSDSDCVPRWRGDIVEEIRFTTDDTASDFYRAGKF